MILGVDLGASAVKIVGMEGEALRLTHYEQNNNKTAAEILLRFMAERELPTNEIQKLVATGLNAEWSNLKNLGLSYQEVPELLATGRGATWLTRETRAVVASFGTGTAFLRAWDGEYTHLGGTGVGGGTLVGLGTRILGCGDPLRLSELAEQGDVSQVDLTIGDLCSGSESLPVEMTASNLAKTSGDQCNADWAAGILNLVLQVVGSMAMFCANGCGADTVIVTGAPAALPAAKAAYAKFERIYGKRFLLPEQGCFATAIGAVLVGREML